MDNPKKKKIDGKRISTQKHEITYWCNKFDCSQAQLRRAKSKVGDSVAAVKDYFKALRIGVWGEI